MVHQRYKGSSFVLGITGHRDLKAEALPHYRQALRKLLIQLQIQHPSLHLWSPLSDGADRLIIEEALKLNISFSAILPMPERAYEKDFSTASQPDFHHLLHHALKIITLPTLSHNIDLPSSRALQYEQCGHFIADHCDALVTLWDGKQTGLQGGTGEIVAYYLAKERCTLYDLRVSRHHDISNVKAQFKKIDIKN